MKVTTKRISIAVLSVVLALFLVLGVCMLDANKSLKTYAESESAPSTTYYYDNLKNADGSSYTLAKTFYGILDELNTSGDFKDGVVSRSLNDVLTSEQIKAWVENGELTIPKAFSAARDSYLFDHPEIFYIDLYKLTISAGRTSGVYSAYVDCGLEANCYADNGTLTSEKQVNDAIAVYEGKIDEVIAYAREQAEKDTYGNNQDYLLANYANEYIAKHVQYDTEGMLETVATGSYTRPYIGDAYGALVLNKCVCRGYAFAYKAVLDKLGIPCVVVSGNSMKRASDGSETATGEAHSWNYVWLENMSENDGIATVAEVKEGNWYAYDVTWNSTTGNSSGYVCMNALTASRSRMSDPIVSSSNYAMPYPALSQVNYGNTTYNDEFMHSYSYKRDTTAGKDGLDDYGNPFMTKEERVSYRGKGALELWQEGIHIIFRYYTENAQGEKYWTAWASLGAMSYIVEGMIEEEHQTVVPMSTNSIYSQFAVVDVAPNLEGNPDYTPKTVLKVNSRNNTAPNLYYSRDYVDANGKDLGEHMLYISEVYVNKTYGTYSPAPYITSTNPKHTETIHISDNMAVSSEDTTMADQYAFTLNVTYDEKLRVIDDSQPIGIDFVGEFNNIKEHAFLVKFSDGQYVHLSDDGYTLSFKFKPSLMYEHNSSLYSFYFDNVGSTKISNGKETLKAPNPAHFHFARAYMCCPQILGGGRLWIDCCAQPTLVSNSDLAAMDFKDPDGNSTFSEQARSQMMLVVNNASPEHENDILNGIDENFGIKEADIKSSETYDINLQICGKYPTIADGSYVKIALGFPEGYGPKDEGVTFKLYHRKHTGGNNYIIEEVPCVVTQFGIVATVTSFSPYMVAAVDASKATTDKTIYATIGSNGGTLSKADGQVKTVKEGETCTYEIKPNEGYQIFSVTLNGKNVTSQVANGKLTLAYDDMSANNELEIKYVADGAVQRILDNNIVAPAKVVVDGNTVTKVVDVIDTPDYLVVPATQPNALMIAILVIVGVLVVAAIAAVVVIVIRRNKGNAEADE